MNSTILRNAPLRASRFPVRPRVQASKTVVGAGQTFVDQRNTQSQFNTRTATDPPPSSGAAGPSRSAYENMSSAHNPAFSSTLGNGPPPFQSDPTISDEPTSKIGPWVTALLVGGFGLLAYGVGEIYGALTMWPKELRSDLRQGLKEDLKGDKGMAERYLLRAWNTAKSLPLSHFGSKFKKTGGAYLKTTGIAITLAAIYESDGKLKEAYDVYEDALKHMQVESIKATPGPIVGVDEEPAPGTAEKQGHVVPKGSASAEGESVATSRLIPDLTPRERMRAIAISYKLAELAGQMHLPKSEEEKWLVNSVETVLRDVMGSPAIAEVVVKSTDTSTGKEVEESREIIEQLKLPSWALKHDLAAPFEALGSFYSREGRIDYAMPLYLQAVAVLIPPPPQVSSADDQCRAAQIMSNISELILRSSATESRSSNNEALIQAEAWAQKGVEIASRVRKSNFVKHPTCEVAYAFGLFNLGVIRDMSGDESKARQLFSESFDQSKSIGFEEGIKNAEDAMDSLRRRAFGTAPRKDGEVSLLST